MKEVKYSIQVQSDDKQRFGCGGDYAKNKTDNHGKVVNYLIFDDFRICLSK